MAKQDKGRSSGTKGKQTRDKPVSGSRKTFSKGTDRRESSGKPYGKKAASEGEHPFKKFVRARPSRSNDTEDESEATKKPRTSKQPYLGKPSDGKQANRSGATRKPATKTQGRKPAPQPVLDFRLNKFLAHAGIASRRKADELIKEGHVTVNGKVVLEVGVRVTSKDKVEFDGKRVFPERKVYVLLNKPKDYLSTTKDDRGRKTIMELVRNASKDRIYPVGRLDRNTTGLILLTNDGDLAQELAHPSKNIKKLYKVELDKPLEAADLTKIRKGVKLEEGKAVVDEIAYASPDKNIIGVELHIGWNRVVRRIFETLGYNVVKLDRVMYAGLTKSNLPRGKWRYLTDKELIMLRHFT